MALMRGGSVTPARVLAQKGYPVLKTELFLNHQAFILMLYASILIPFSGYAEDSTSERTRESLSSLRASSLFLNVDFWNFNQTMSFDLFGISFNHIYPNRFGFDFGLYAVAGGSDLPHPHMQYTRNERGTGVNIHGKGAYALSSIYAKRLPIENIFVLSGGYRRSNFASIKTDDGYYKANIAHMIEGGISYELHAGRGDHRMTVRLSTHLNRAFYSYKIERSWVRDYDSVDVYKYGMRLMLDMGFSVKDLFPLR